MVHSRRSSTPRAWLLIALAPADRSYGGNDGYDDDISTFYSWNSRVPNSRAIAVGDRVVLWDKLGLLGFSVIDNIDTGTGTVDRRLCPDCGSPDIKFRKTKSPDWRCFDCYAEFNDADSEVVGVITYRAEYGSQWVDALGKMTAAEVRGLARSPKSQHAMREAYWQVVQDALMFKGGQAEKNSWRDAHIGPRQVFAEADGVVLGELGGA